ncbi:MAG: MFS transporter [Candidatus Binatia bacterium]
MKLVSRSGAFRALSYPNYFWFWSSYFVSNVGSWMQSISMGWLLFDLTASPLYLGLFSSLRMVMLIVFFILGGIMSDRIDRRKVMLWIQFIAAGTSLVLALLVTSESIQVWHIFVLGAITSTTWAFEQPVRQALLPQLVERDDLVNALALNAVTWNGAGLLGPSLVGFSVAYIGIDGCFYANVISYLTVSALFNIFGRSYITLLPVVAKEVLHLGPAGFGFISAGPGMGTIIGSLGLAFLGWVRARRGVLIALLLAFCSKSHCLRLVRRSQDRLRFTGCGGGVKYGIRDLDQYRDSAACGRVVSRPGLWFLRFDRRRFTRVRRYAGGLCRRMGECAVRHRLGGHWLCFSWRAVEEDSRLDLPITNAERF